MNLPQEFQWLEFYAGHAACTFAMRRAGYAAARFDIEYCKNPDQFGRKTNWMDLMTPAGFAFLSCSGSLEKGKNVVSSYVTISQFPELSELD